MPNSIIYIIKLCCGIKFLRNKVKTKYEGEKDLLLLNSWSGYCPKQLKEFILADKEVNILTIQKN